jgi:hypothetical protein
MKSNGVDASDAIIEGFAFRTELIQDGDILLCTDPDSLISQAIRQATAGTFSHAAICSYRPLFIEADFPGVAEFSLERLNLAKRSNARILRLKPSVPNGAAIATAAARAALRYQTGEYDKIAAIASCCGGLKFTSGIFCSYLVSAAYCAAGLNLTSESAKTPSRTRPVDIENSVYLEDVTDSLLVGAIFDPARGTHYFLDRATCYASDTPDCEKDAISPAQAYNIRLRSVGKRVSDFLETKGLPPVNDYPQAQLALGQYKDAEWFTELDGLFATELRTQAIPVIAAAQPVARKAREKDEKQLDHDLAAGLLDSTSFELTVNQIASRINTTCKLISERQKDLYVLRLFSWKATQALAEAEALICDGLFQNLSSYRRQWQMLEEYAAENGWQICHDEE